MYLQNILWLDTIEQQHFHGLSYSQNHHFLMIEDFQNIYVTVKLQECSISSAMTCQFYNVLTQHIVYEHFQSTHLRTTLLHCLPIGYANSLDYFIHRFTK
jgi:hypothetical protein